MLKIFAYQTGSQVQKLNCQMLGLVGLSAMMVANEPWLAELGEIESRPPG